MESYSNKQETLAAEKSYGPVNLSEDLCDDEGWPSDGQTPGGWYSDAKPVEVKSEQEGYTEALLNQLSTVVESKQDSYTRVLPPSAESSTIAPPLNIGEIKRTRTISDEDATPQPFLRLKTF